MMNDIVPWLKEDKINIMLKHLLLFLSLRFYCDYGK